MAWIESGRSSLARALPDVPNRLRGIRTSPLLPTYLTEVRFRHRRLLPESVPHDVVFLPVQGNDDAGLGGDVVDLDPVGLVLLADRFDGFADQSLLLGQTLAWFVGLGLFEGSFHVLGDRFLVERPAFLPFGGSLLGGRGIELAAEGRVREGRLA